MLIFPILRSSSLELVNSKEISMIQSYKRANEFKVQKVMPLKTLLIILMSAVFYSSLNCNSSRKLSKKNTQLTIWQFNFNKLNTFLT